MIGIEPLLADAGEMIGAVVVIVIMIVSAISQVMGNKKPAQQPRPRPRPPARPAQAGGGRQDPVARELEEFLRRAGGRPAGQRPPPPPQAARPVIARPVAERAVAVEALDELEEIESVAEHVGQRLGGQRVEPHVGRQLGQGVASTGSRVEQQLSQKFDHQIGRLASTPGETATAAVLAESEGRKLVDDLPPGAAAGLAAMLSNPANLRQAILLSEILERPEKRWS